MTTNAYDHLTLIGGPYRAPAVEVGDWLDCAFGGRVRVVGWSEGPIPWPVRRSNTRTRQTLILCGDLEIATRTESNVALSHWFGVGDWTVWNWKRALGVTKRTSGTRRLQIQVGYENLDEATRARGVTLAHQPENLKKMGAAVRASAKRRAAWTPEAEALLGTLPDAQAALKLGRSYTQVWTHRRALGIATYQRSGEERRAGYRAGRGFVSPRRHALLARRTELGLLQREVAARAGLYPVTYTKIENGTQLRVLRTTLESLATALECEVTTLAETEDC